MSQQTSVAQDCSKLSRLDRTLFGLEIALNFAGGLVIFALVLLATTNVLGRWLFATPVSGYIDWVEQAMAFIAFLGIAYTMRLGGHIRMDMVIGRFKGRALWIAEWFSTILMLIITLLLTYGSFLHFLRAYQIGDSSIDLQLPIWPAKLVVPVALCVLSLRLLLQIWSYGSAAYKNSQTPIAVPLPESIEEVAQKESRIAL